jgi:selenide,water dikinase
VLPALDLGPDVPAELIALAHDPQTSGGLLVAVPADRLAAVESGLASAGVPARRVGHVDVGTGVALR